MILLASTSDLVRITTSSAANIDVHASWVDMNGSTVTPGRTNTAIASATTTTVVGSPASSTYRTIKTLTIRNRHASTACDVTFLHTDGSTSVELIKINLAAGEVLHYHEAAGFWVTDAQGREKQLTITTPPIIGALNTLVLPSDVADSSGAATLTDITGFKFAALTGETYWFRATIDYTSAAAGTGAGWSVGGVAQTRISFVTSQPLTATSQTYAASTAINTPAAANASSLAAGNIALIEGLCTPSANGDVQFRFSTEIDTSAITCKAGSLLQWMRVL